MTRIETNNIDELIKFLGDEYSYLPVIVNECGFIPDGTITFKLSNINEKLKEHMDFNVIESYMIEKHETYCILSVNTKTDCYYDRTTFLQLDKDSDEVRAVIDLIEQTVKNNAILLEEIQKIK